MPRTITVDPLADDFATLNLDAYIDDSNVTASIFNTKADYILTSEGLFKNEAKKHRPKSVRLYLSPKETERLWEAQGRRCGLCSLSAANGKAWHDIKHLFQVDHIWSIRSLADLNITDASVVNSAHNFWIISKGINLSKNHLALEEWARYKNKSSAYWNWVQDFSIHQLAYILKLQKSLHPEWSLSSWETSDLTLRGGDDEFEDEYYDDLCPDDDED